MRKRPRHDNETFYSVTYYRVYTFVPVPEKKKKTDLCKTFPKTLIRKSRSIATYLLTNLHEPLRTTYSSGSEFLLDLPSTYLRVKMRITPTVLQWKKKENINKNIKSYSYRIRDPEIIKTTGHVSEFRGP